MCGIFFPPCLPCLYSVQVIIYTVWKGSVLFRKSTSKYGKCLFAQRLVTQFLVPDLASEPVRSGDRPQQGDRLSDHRERAVDRSIGKEVQPGCEQGGGFTRVVGDRIILGPPLGLF